MPEQGAGRGRLVGGALPGVCMPLRDWSRRGCGHPHPLLWPRPRTRRACARARSAPSRNPRRDLRTCVAPRRLCVSGPRRRCRRRRLAGCPGNRGSCLGQRGSESRVRHAVEAPEDPAEPSGEESRASPPPRPPGVPKKKNKWGSRSLCGVPTVCRRLQKRFQ